MFQYAAEPLICLQNLEIIDAVTARNGKKHKGQDHLGVGPALGRPKAQMAVDALRDAESTGKVEIQRKAGKCRSSCRLPFFFVLVRKGTLWHNRFTSLVIGFGSANPFYHPCSIRASEVFHYFWWWIRVVT